MFACMYVRCDSSHITWVTQVWAVMEEDISLVLLDWCMGYHSLSLSLSTGGVVFRPSVLGSQCQLVRSRGQYDSESWRVVSLLEPLQGPGTASVGSRRGCGHHGECQRWRHHWSLHRRAQGNIWQQCRATGKSSISGLYFVVGMKW